MTHAGARGDDDAVAGEVEAPSHVEAVAEGAEGGVEAVDVPVGLGAQEHADGSDAEHVGRAVVLALVDFLLADALEATGTGCREDTEFEETLPVPAQLFNSDRTDRFADSGGLDEFAQALGLGRTVVVENPPPLGGGEGAPWACARRMASPRVRARPTRTSSAPAGTRSAGKGVTWRPATSMMVRESGAID